MSSSAQPARRTPASAATKKLTLKISEADRKAEAARYRAQAVKADFKLARKRFKQARKAAKLARKELKALKQLLEQASQPARTQPTVKSKRAATPRKSPKLAPRRVRKKATASAPALPPPAGKRDLSLTEISPAAAVPTDDIANPAQSPVAGGPGSPADATAAPV